MAKTEIRSGQIQDTTISREDMNIATSGKAVVAKIIAGTNVTIGSTGADPGTGDVTINSSGGGGTNALLDGSNHTDTTAGTVVRGDLITGQGVTPTWTRLAKGTANQKLSMDGTATDVAWADDIASFGITIDGGGSAITTGVKGYVEIVYNATILGWTILADVSGSCVIDVWKDTYANYPPTVADTIAGTEKPTLTAAIKNQDTTLTTWTTSITAGDIIAFNVDSATTVTRVHLIIKVKKKV